MKNNTDENNGKKNEGPTEATGNTDQTFEKQKDDTSSSTQTQQEEGGTAEGATDGETAGAKKKPWQGLGLGIHFNVSICKAAAVVAAVGAVAIGAVVAYRKYAS